MQRALSLNLDLATLYLYPGQGHNAHSSRAGRETQALRCIALARSVILGLHERR